jgi:hypothetical protein
MEGFTIVLLISWLILIGCFVAMYFMDKATKEAAERRPGSTGPEAATPRR